MGPLDMTKTEREEFPGPELGVRYSKSNPPGRDTALVRLRLERWLTADFGKLPRL